MGLKKRILLKISGQAFVEQDQLSPVIIKDLARQIKQCQDTHQFGIVTGGGNFFRGCKEGARLKVTPSVGHQVGMLATIMNGLIIQDLFEQAGISTSLFTALPSPTIGKTVSPQAIVTALEQDHCLIFSGGTGNPFFTTDTTALLRGLQIGAQEIWKGTNVDGIYDQDPHKNPGAHKLSSMSYAQALKNNYGIMDRTAFALGADHNMRLRVFNIFESDALIKTITDASFGTLETQ